VDTRSTLVSDWGGLAASGWLAAWRSLFARCDGAAGKGRRNPTVRGSRIDKDRMFCQRSLGLRG
jgi:hypothetical protein